MVFLPIPEFFEREANAIIADMIAYYEFTTGKVIAESDPERLIINMFAYREVVNRNADNDAAKQMLVRFSRYPVLDYLGQLVGVTRLPAAKAVCTLEFTLVTGHGAVIVPQGTRVSSEDGAVVFETTDDIIGTIGVDVFEVSATAQTGGTYGNGYIPGKISALIDSLAFVDTVENVDVTSGGSNEEIDEQLRDRIVLAPSSFSVAGPTDAYKFFAFSANSAIIDVEVTNPIPGVVYIYPLTDTVPTPQSILDEVLAACSGDKKVPLLDEVVVIAPTPINYSIVIDLTLYNDTDPVLATQSITEALTAYSKEKAGKMGIDIIRNQIISLAVPDGVYNADLTSLLADIVIADNEFGNCTSIVVNVIGYNNG